MLWIASGQIDAQVMLYCHAAGAVRLRQKASSRAGARTTSTATPDQPSARCWALLVCLVGHVGGDRDLTDDQQPVD